MNHHASRAATRAAEEAAYVWHTHLPCAVVNAAVSMNCPLRQVRFLNNIAGIVEEFGKFNRLINPGFNMINPCTEEVR